jgi:hypothetical protein
LAQRRHSDVNREGRAQVFERLNHPLDIGSQGQALHLDGFEFLGRGGWQN